MLLTLTACAEVTMFTYQGRFTDNGNPATGYYDLQCALYGSSSGSAQVGPTLSFTNGAVTNGLFTATLDFGGGIFTGEARWIELRVRTNGAAEFTVLFPRQKITAAPMAMYSQTASNLTGTVSLAQLPAAVITNNASGLALAGSFSGSGAGLGGVNAAALQGVSAGGFIQNTTSPQTANLNITGNAVIGGTISGDGSALTGVNGSVAWQSPASTFVLMSPNTGYMITNSGDSVLLLPASPSPGQTFRVSGAGAGTWKIGQNSNQFVTANFLPQSQWMPGSAPASKWWRCVASSADGVKLIAAANLDYIYTSADSGATWLFRSVPQTNWIAVASSTNGVKLVAAVGYDDPGGGIYVSSSSGSGWSQTSAPITNWIAVASSADGTKLVAVAGSFVHASGIWTSGNSGSTWTQTAAPITNWQAVASSADGTKLVAAVYGGAVYLSTDSGASWSPTSLPLKPWAAVSSSADGGKLVALPQGSFAVYCSTDSGTTWRTTTLPASSWKSASSSADGRVVFASTTSEGVFVSFDYGATWSSTGAPLSDWVGLAAAADGSKVVGVEDSAGGGIFRHRVSTTSPGIYGYLSGTLGSAVELQYIGSNRFISLSHDGAINAY